MTAAELSPRLSATLRARWPDLALGLFVAAIGFEQATRPGGDAGTLVIGLGMGVAAGLYRVAPAWALGLVWATAALQVYSAQDVAPAQLAALLVSYGAARHGRTATVWISGLSIPLGAAAALVYLAEYGTALPYELGLTTVEQVTSVTSLTAGYVLAVAVLAGPWVLGLVLRLSATYRRSTEDRERAEAEAARARELAELRADQARLARDVHDVVGHSLTVILAQADSAEAMADTDIEKIRGAMANIAASARHSLGDVRHVLSATLDGDAAAPRPPGELDSLVDGVRAAGNDVQSRVDGEPRPMPPELDVVAYRVLQEMLTNALKHGRRGAPVHVVRAWNAEHLVIQVRNLVGETPTRDGEGAGIGRPNDGVGLAGMQRRLEAVGGVLEARREESPAGWEFVATGWVPLRASVSRR